MSDKRDNCIILLIEAPVPENINPELKAAFGAERAAHINLDLLQNAYKLAKNFPDSTLILSFERSQRHPDLTWLDPEDPGFLESKGKTLEGRIADAFQLAFNTGAKKVLLLNHLSRIIKADWLSQTFDSVTEKTIALGLNQDGTIYIVGLTPNNIKLLEGIPFSSPKTAGGISEKAKKNKIAVFSLPEAVAVKSDEPPGKGIDAGDPDTSLLMKPQAVSGEQAALPAAHRQEEKKHGRRGHKNAFLQPPLPDTEQKPL